MAKYLLKVNYSSQGTQGLLKEGGSGRRTKVTKVVEGLGGKVEAWYYALGETDLFVILDLPDAQTAAAFSLVVHAAGAAQIVTVPLLTAEDLDAASKKSVAVESVAPSADDRSPIDSTNRSQLPANRLVALGLYPS